jgi:anti-sigma factor RsiW
VDGELELTAQLQMEAHLAECAACRTVFERHRALQQAIKDADLYRRAPAGLERRIRATAAPTRPWLSNRWVGMTALAAMVVLVVSMLPGLVSWLGSEREDVLAQQVVSSHVRSLQPGHLTDVVSSDQHTVKPWFAGRVDFSPPVVDLRQSGFPLVGGRLDSIDGQTVAVLVYQRRQHVINVFVRPASGRRAEQTVHVRGYTIIAWTERSVAEAAVSDLNADELRSFVQLLRQVHPPA